MKHKIVNTGSAANDFSGDGLRTAMLKVNTNTQEFARAVNQYNKEIYQEQEEKTINSTQAANIAGNGNIQASSSYTTRLYNVAAGEVYKVVGQLTGSVGLACYAMYTGTPSSSTVYNIAVNTDFVDTVPTASFTVNVAEIIIVPVGVTVIAVTTAVEEAIQMQLYNTVAIFNDDYKRLFSIVLNGYIDYSDAYLKNGYLVNVADGTLFPSIELAVLSPMRYCKGAQYIELTMPQDVSASAAGIVFYTEQKGFISGIARPVGTKGTVTKQYAVPSGCMYFRSAYWNSTNRALYGNFNCIVKYVDTKALQTQVASLQVQADVNTSTIDTINSLVVGDYDITAKATVTPNVGVVYTSGTTSASAVVSMYSGKCRGSYLTVKMPTSTNAATSFGIAFFNASGTYLYGYKLNYAATYAVETRKFRLRADVASYKTGFFTDTVTYGAFSATVSVRDFESKTYGNSEVIDGQGININAAGKTLGETYTSAALACTDYIRCDKAKVITITVPKLTTAASQGLVFYDSQKVPIADSGVLRPSGSANGVQTITLQENQIPENAFYFRSTFWNYANTVLYGNFSCIILYEKNFLGFGKYKPYRAGFINFSVLVNQSISNFWDTTATAQDTEILKRTTGVLFLPTGYTEYGKPVGLIIYFHGRSRGVWYNVYGALEVDGEGTNDAFIAQKEKYLAAGYAVMDCHGAYDSPSPVYGVGSPQTVSAYQRCYEYVIANYNIDPNVYVIGGSMGGHAALNYCFTYPHIKALALLAPHTAYQCSWDALDRAPYVTFYGFSNTTTPELEKIKGYDPSMRIQTFNSVPQFSYFKHPIKLWIGSLENVAGNLVYPYATAFMQALRNGNSNAQLRIVDGADHSLVAGGNDMVDQEVITWIKKH